MSTIPEPNTPADFTTVHEFAQQYRVDASVVRSWIKKGHINYVLVGPRHMRRIRKSDILTMVQEGAQNGSTGTEARTTASGTRGDAGGQQEEGARGDAGGAGRPAANTEGKGRSRSAAAGTR